MKLTVTLAIINAVQVFDTVYIPTKGGPGTATITPSVVLYEQGALPTGNGIRLRNRRYHVRNCYGTNSN